MSTAGSISRLMEARAIVIDLFAVEDQHRPIGDPNDQSCGNGVLWFDVEDFDAAMACAAALVVEVVLPPAVLHHQ